MSEDSDVDGPETSTSSPVGRLDNRDAQLSKKHPRGPRKSYCWERTETQSFLSDSSQQKPIFHAALIPESASVCDKGALNVLQR